VIDLDERERITGPVLTQCGSEVFTCSLATMSGRRSSASVNVPHPSLDGTVIRRLEIVCVATRLDVFHEIGKPRTFPREIQILDGGLYNGFDFCVEHTRLVGLTAMLRDQC
jgi:hypothetical protein